MIVLTIDYKSLDTCLQFDANYIAISSVDCSVVPMNIVFFEVSIIGLSVVRIV